VLLVSTISLLLQYQLFSAPSQHYQSTTAVLLLLSVFVNQHTFPKLSQVPKGQLGP